MRKSSFSILISSILLSIVLLSSMATEVFAESKIGTDITLTKLGDIKIGDSFLVSGTIKDKNGKPIANKPVIFEIDGEYLGQARSNLYGFFEREFNTLLKAGTYRLTATSSTTHLLEKTSSSIYLKILPTEVQIQTVPAIPGITFEMDRKRFVSDKDGLAKIEIYKPGEYRLEVLSDLYQNPLQEVEFARWLNESYEPFQDLNVPTEKVIQVGFNVYQRVGQSFVDLDGTKVDPKRISEFTIRSAQGDMFVLHDGRQRLIPASRIARRVTGLEETKLLYSVLSVIVDGSNVVNQSQQRFYTNPGENWTISLLLYSLNIQVKDGLLGSPVGNSVDIQFPDGQIENYQLDQNGMVKIQSLARGPYYFEVLGIKGVSNRIPVALSRDQEVNTKIITYVDIAIVGVPGVVFALSLLFYGRPSLLNFLKKKKKQVVQEKEMTFPTKTYSEYQTQEVNYMPITYEPIKQLDDLTFHLLTGISRDLFDKMLAQLENSPLHSDRLTKLSWADQIFLTHSLF